MRFYLISLGCAKNLVDSEKLTSCLLRDGYSITGDIKDSSLIIINTCGFIEDAKKESIDTILNVLQEKPDTAKVLVFGCLVQRYQKKLEQLIPEVDLFLPLLPDKDLSQKIQMHFPAHKKIRKKEQKKIFFKPPSYQYIKISDGCNNFCSYCTIPLIRGTLKSLQAKDIVREVKNALELGAYEINLIAQDITVYGTDLYGKPSLEILLKEILALKKVFWIRLLYLYPTRISHELIKIIRSEDRIIKYLDIPIQHVSDRLLNLMNRDYTKELLKEKIDILREKIPALSLRTSLITGFPTETELDFNELFNFIQHIQFDHLGVFEYSPEEQTPAYSLKPRVPNLVRRKRKKIIMKYQKEAAQKKNKALIGKIFPCLIEMPVDEYGSVWTGRIYSQAPEVDGVVYITGFNQTNKKIANIRIKGYKDYDLVGECIEQ